MHRKYVDTFRLRDEFILNVPVTFTGRIVSVKKVQLQLDRIFDSSRVVKSYQFVISRENFIYSRCANSNTIFRRIYETTFYMFLAFSLL